MADLHNFKPGMSDPPENHAVITPADSDLPFVLRELYVGGGGNVVLRDKGTGTDCTYVGVLAGSFICGRFTQVRSTGNSATNLVGRW